MGKSIEIYNLLIILLFGAILSSLVINFIKNHFIKKMPNSLRIIFIIVLGSILCFATYKIMDKISEKNRQHIIEKNKKILTEAIRTNKIIMEQKKALAAKERLNQIIKTVQKYFDVSKSKNILRYDSLFTFPVKKYFVMTNVSKDKVNERIRFAWHKNPSLSFTVTNENTHIDDYGDSVIVIINLNIENKIKNVIAKIKYDKNLKIWSLNNFYQTQQQTHKILSPKDTLTK